MSSRGLTNERLYFSRALRVAGYKATEGRLEFLRLLKQSGKPLSIQELLRRSFRVRVDQATAYRILSVLEEVGMIRQVNLRHGHADYEFIDLNDHHHVICVRCKKAEDIPGCPSTLMMREALKKARSFMKITQHSFEFFGLCKTCFTSGK